MMGLDEVRKNKEIISVIDWDMTPEEAVTLYLEWGNSWSHGKSLVRSKDDVSYYFVVNTWEVPPKIFFDVPSPSANLNGIVSCYFVKEQNVNGH